MRLGRIERDSQCQKRRNITREDGIFQLPREVALEFRTGNMCAVVIQVPVEAVDNLPGDPA